MKGWVLGKKNPNLRDRWRSGGMNRNVPAHPLNDPVSQIQADPIMWFDFCCEKWLKHPRTNLLFDALSVVNNPDELKGFRRFDDDADRGALEARDSLNRIV